MKKISLFILLAVSLPLMAAASENHGRPASEVLADIIKYQNISQTQDINCEEVTDEQFVELGDAAMEQRHPGEQHVAMDQMMGGEGSEALRSMHIAMGKNYLGCSADERFMNIGMMGGNMMDSFLGNNTFRYRGGYGMMGAPGTSFFSFSYFITIFLIWVILILGITALIKWIRHKK